MMESNLRQRVETFIEALHRVERDGGAAVDALVQLFADDAVVVNAMTRRGQDDRRGPEAIHSFWQQYAATLGRGQSEFAHVTVGDGAAGLFWTTHDDRGARYDGATLLEFDEAGRIRLLRGYYDPEEFRRQREAA